MTHDPIPPPLTEEQSAILDAAKYTPDCIMVIARAGTGKTFVLQQIEKAVAAGPILYLAFNKKIAVEAEGKMSSTTQVRTFNGLGHRIWADFTKRKLSLVPKKIPDIFRAIIDEAPLAKHDRNHVWDNYWAIIEAVNHARTVGFIPLTHGKSDRSLVPRRVFENGLEESLDDRAYDWFERVLCRSIKLAYDGVIDFSDQIYMPTLFGGRFPQFPLTLVDEYQDLNTLNHHMISKLVQDRRLIGVGDPAQSIYGFRGAVPNGMAHAIAAFKMMSLPLSISFRCPEAIVSAVHWRVPEFRASRPGGAVISRPRQSLLDFAEGSAIICRNNAPLFSLAMRLLAAGKPVTCGSATGGKLMAQMKKLGDLSLDRTAMLSAITAWEAEKVARGSTTAEDEANCMRVFASHAETLDQALAYAKYLFDSAGPVELLTGHKAKGREWPTVYLLDLHLLKDEEQDSNLRYVMFTRASETLFQIRWVGVQ